MMRYAFPCNIVEDHEEGEGFVVTFPDVPEAITGADTWEKALEMAEDALGVALGMYVANHRDVPMPSPVLDGATPVSVPLVVAAKLALYTAMRDKGLTNVALAERLGVSETAIRRLVDPGHRSHIDHVQSALQKIGYSLVIDYQPLKSNDLNMGEENLAGRFDVGFDENLGLFKAYVHNPDRHNWAVTEVSHSLEELLSTCRERGLVFDGLNKGAAEYIHHWMVVERPTFEFVKDLWEGMGQTKRGPVGFRPKITEEL